MIKPYTERAELAWTDDSVRLILTPSSFAKSALYYAQEIGRFRTLPGYFTEREQLNSHLLVYTIAGKGRLLYRNKTYELAAGHAFFIDCMDYQEYRTDPADLWELMWVHLNGQSVRAYFGQYDQGGDPVRALAADSRVPVLLQELLELHKAKSIRNELIASKLIVDLLTELLMEQTVPETGSEEWPEFVTACVQLIEKRYSEKLSLEQLARSVAVNKYHLAKEFKRHTGFSPGEFMINTRITRAKELLKYTEIPVSEIAELIGIDNVTHFINLFKDRVDLTPLKYRKTWRETNR